MVGTKRVREQFDKIKIELREDAIDLVIYEERKNGEYISEEEAMKLLKRMRKI